MAVEENFAVEYHPELHTVVLTFRKPGDPYHTLDEEVVTELGQLLTQYDQNPEIRGVILTGEGDKVFSTGADIEGSFNEDKSPERMRHFSHMGKLVFGLLSSSHFVSLAAINGLCLGGGLELALACDLRIASRRARLGLPEINLGLIPGWGGTQLLPRLVGHQQALRMILSGDPVSAQTAAELGLVLEVVAPEELIQRALTIIGRITKHPRKAIARCKRAVNCALSTPLSEGMALESELFGLAWASDERVEGVKNFLNRRRPQANRS